MNKETFQKIFLCIFVKNKKKTKRIKDDQTNIDGLREKKWV